MRSIRTHGGRSSSNTSPPHSTVTMTVGWVLAKYLPVRASVALFLLIELFMVAMWRDNLSLNVIMLLRPVESIKQWQLRAGK